MTVTRAQHLAEMGDRWVTIDIVRKVGELLFPFRGEMGPHLALCGLGLG